MHPLPVPPCLIRMVAWGLVIGNLFGGCARYPQHYEGVNTEDSRFERGISVPPLDLMGDFLSKPYQLLFWSRDYGNHSISEHTEDLLRDYIDEHGLIDVKVRLNQWAPHKEIKRLVLNQNIVWPYKILFFPSTLIASLLGRPLGGLILSDYYDPGSNTINLFSNHPAIALHEGGHSRDFASRRYKGTYGVLRILPGINVFQEAIASDEAFEYFESRKHYPELLHAYNMLYPAYGTYISSYLGASVFGLLGGIGVGHILGAAARHDKTEELRDLGVMPHVV